MANLTQVQETVEKCVPLFYGQVDVDPSDVHFFIDACKKVEKIFAGKADQSALLLEEVLFRLRGRAYTAFRDITIRNLKEFYSTLSKKFLPAYTVEFLQDRLREARQNKLESCSDFGDRIQGYALDYEAGVRTKFGDENALPKPLVTSMEQDAFTRGLHNEAIRVHVSLTVGKSTKELVEIADKIERQLGYGSSSMKETSVQGSSQLKCQLCDKSGHSAKTCHRNTQTHTQSSNRLPAVMCRYCKRLGHALENCAARRAANEKYQFRHAQPQFPRTNYESTYLNRSQQNFQPNHRNLPHGNPNNNPPNRQNPYQPPNPTTNQKQPGYQRNQNMNVNQLTNDLRRMNINYIESVDENSIHHQGNGDGLVEHQQHQL